MSGVISLVAFIVIIFVVSFVVYYLIYNKRINDRLKNNESLKHNSMVGVDTIGKFLTIFFGVAIVFILFTELNSLKTDIEVQAESRNVQIAGLEGRINELEEKLDQQNSLMNNFQYTVGEMDLNSRTVELQFVCTPKMYSRDTKLTLVNGEKKIEFACGENGVFTATETYSIFEGFDENSVICQEDGGVFKSSEEMGLVPIKLASDCLPELGDGRSIEVLNKGKNVEISGNLVLGAADEFENIELYVLRNDARIKEISVDRADGESHFAVKVEAGDRDRVSVVLSGTDKYGFTHKKLLVGVNVDDERLDGYASIYDSEGNLLSGADIR